MAVSDLGACVQRRTGASGWCPVGLGRAYAVGELTGRRAGGAWLGRKMLTAFTSSSRLSVVTPTVVTRGSSHLTHDSLGSPHMTITSDARALRERSSGPAIEAEHLVKRFGDMTAVDDVSFSVPQGTVLGLLGPNGAGKTTTVRMMTTLSAPTSGSARVAGHDVVRDPELVRRSMGLTGQAATVDELTTGLDPRSRVELWDVLRGLVRDGTTLLLTTQYLEEADQLADRIVVIDHGRIIAEGTPLELKDQSGKAAIVLTVSHADQLEAARALLAAHVPEVHVDAAARQLTAPADGLSDMTRVATVFERSEIVLDDLGLQRPSLDDVFLSLTGHRAEPDGHHGTGSTDEHEHEHDQQDEQEGESR